MYSLFQRQMFAKWNQPRARLRRRRLQRSATSTQPASLPSGEQTFRQIVGHENLLRVFDRMRRSRGQAPGIDGFTYADFSRGEIAGVLRAVTRSILAGTYVPDPTRAVQIEKANGRFRELHLPTIVDRAVAAAVADYLTRLIDPAFSPRSFGFRPRRGVWTLLVELERLILGEKRVVIAQDDIRTAFDTVPIGLALECFFRHVQDADLLSLIGIILQGHDGLDRVMGLDQGSALSPLALNAVLDWVLDRPSSADPAQPPILRYADNLVVVSRSVAEARQALQRVAELLAPQGLDLKGEDGPPAILTRQGARIDILGLRVGLEDSRLRVGLAPEAYEGLDRRLDEAHATDNPPQIARMVIQGWIASHAPGLESLSVDQMLPRIRQVATRKGFREIGTDNLIRDQILCAVARWRAYRDSSQEEVRGTDLDLGGEDEALRATSLTVLV